MIETKVSVTRVCQIRLSSDFDNTKINELVAKISKINNVENAELDTPWIRIKYKFPETSLNDIKQLISEYKIDQPGNIYHALVCYMEKNEIDTLLEPGVWQNYIQPIYSNLHSRNLKSTRDRFKKQWQNYKEE